MDLDEGTAVICRQLQRWDGRLTVCPPKTAHSTRVIALDRTTIAALRAHRSRQQAEPDAYGDGYRDSGHVFTNLNGDPVSPGRLTHFIQKLIVEHGVPPIRLHDLRHRAATLALAAGGKFPELFDAVQADAGIQVVLTGVRMSRMKAVMERWVQTCRRELLDRTLIWNRRHLLHTLREFEVFYNQHRPHQGIANARPLNPLP
ncbi:hypothetical protein GCM10010191_59050 [Actinomadura vinacea]|uniref:Integrase catalytic domain-containing protein n=1 Tax=Actinomadura vinacea TaxID=115336 RepID=A0ABN3JPW8_9ACTN